MPCPEKFQETLDQYKIDVKLKNAINEGYEGLTQKSPKPQKAAYFKRAVDLMTEQLPKETMQEMLEVNACCTGGNREKASKAFAKANKDLPLTEKLKKIKDVPNMGNPVLNEDGTITVYAVYYEIDGVYQCACVNYNKVKRDYPVSKNYCYCCAGHFKYHYEIMLGQKLKAVEIVSSPLDSEGKDPCIIRFALE